MQKLFKILTNFFYFNLNYFFRKAQEDKRKFTGVLMTDKTLKISNDTNGKQLLLTDMINSNVSSDSTPGITKMSNIMTANVDHINVVPTPNDGLHVDTPPFEQVNDKEGSVVVPIGNRIEDGVQSVVVGDTSASPLKPEIKEKKRRIRIDDDDESPTFNPLTRGIRRGRGRGGRGSRGGARGALRMQQRQLQRNNAILGNASGGAPQNPTMFLLNTPEKSHDGIIFTTPEGKVSGIFRYFFSAYFNTCIAY